MNQLELQLFKQSSPIYEGENLTSEQSGGEVRLLVRWVGKSCTRTRGKVFWYYRYYWYEKPGVGEATAKPYRQPLHRHIAGGRVGSEVGEERASIVRKWIEQNVAHLTIVERLNGWNEGRGHNLEALELLS